MHAYHHLRREKLLGNLPVGSLVVLATNPERTRSNDTLYPFRPNSNFYYFTGCTEPRSIMLLSHEEYILFVRPKNKQKELWDGEVLGLDKASEVLGCEAKDINTLETQLPTLLKQYTKVYFDFDNIETPLLESLTTLSYESLSSLITPLRTIKDESEIDAIRTACSISIEAHINAMKSVTQCEYEYQVQSIFEQAFAYHNTEHAYTPILASGNNANTLHYIKNNQPLSTNDLLLIDAGCEYNYYASDITRTFPISGTFTSEQATLYDIVLATQLYAISKVQPHTTIKELDTFAKEYMATQLIELGMLDTHAQLIEVFPHGIGHFLGLDVHDVGGKDIILEPNMILTIEPGIYVSYDAKINAKFNAYKGIGIRIEDNVLVTKSGCEVLTKECPKERTAIEALIQQR